VYTASAAWLLVRTVKVCTVVLQHCNSVHTPPVSLSIAFGLIQGVLIQGVLATLCVRLALAGVHWWHEAPFVCQPLRCTVDC
jgi:hypothetical protein